MIWRFVRAAIVVTTGIVATTTLSPALHGQALKQTMTLAIDATDAPRKILHSRETIAVKPGPLTLLYPKWIPGEHGPTGPVTDVAGIRIVAQNKALPWRRDLEEMYAIHFDVPAGVDSIDVGFDFILPPVAEGFSSGASSTANLLVLSWNQVVLYPSTARPDDILVTPSLTLPTGWKFATALTAKAPAAKAIQFDSVSLTMLVDSPVLSGAFVRKIDLTPASGVPHFLNLASDSEAAVMMPADMIADYKQLVLEANALFGSHHYGHYDFLYTLSDQVAHFGLEHHQSSDDRMGERTLLDDDLRRTSADLLTHEFVHSWNGKFRRPAGLATGDFSAPMKGDLLWVYEGLTQYLGKVLAGRSGLWTPEDYRGNLAYLAATLDNRPGREWRPLQDTADEAQLLYYTRGDWDSWRRSTDYYDEGDLIWLEADVTIRQLTAGKQSLDDFCKKFHGGESGAPAVRPYIFEEVVTALNTIAPYDWKAFFTTRLQSLDPHAPMGGIEKSGWKLAYRDTPTAFDGSADAAHRTTDLRYSIGALLGDDGAVQDVIPDSPAFKAGLSPGMKIVAVNGRKYSSQVMHDAIAAGPTMSAPLELIAANGEFFKTFAINYHGGERYPYLERDASKPDLLSAIIAPAVKK